MVKVKICGITNTEDALKAHELGADFVGFIFFEASPRKIKPENAHSIIKALPKGLSKVGLFLGQDAGTVRAIAERCELDFLQLHGYESPEYCRSLAVEFKIIKSFRMGHLPKGVSMNDYDDACHYYLFDTYVKGVPGGTGKTFNWKLLRKVPFKKPIFVAGGLKPENVREAIMEVQPYAVDVASGVEASPGKKDHKLLKEFIDNAKKT
jgi:phosphoribosylanthranilate isomerase